MELDLPCAVVSAVSSGARPFSFVRSTTRTHPFATRVFQGRAAIATGKLSNVMFVIESITDTLGRTRKERVYCLTEVQADRAQL